LNGPRAEDVPAHGLDLEDSLAAFRQEIRQLVTQTLTVMGQFPDDEAITERIELLAEMAFGHQPLHFDLLFCDDPVALQKLRDYAFEDRRVETEEWNEKRKQRRMEKD
jgi:hypothetical protein